MYSVKTLINVSIAVIYFALVGGHAMAANIVALNITPLAQNHHIGASFTADLIVSGLEGQMDLGAFNLNLNYDTNILMFESYALASGIGSDALDLSMGDLGNGSINLAACIDNPTLEDSFSIATLSFSGISSGIAALSIADYAIFYDGAHNAIDLHGSVSGIVNVNAAPVPAAAWPLGTGLIGLAALRRHMK